MIQLYGRRNSINVQKVSWALCELNIEFKWHDEHGKFGTVNVENYEKLNPQLIVPTLDYNGTIINQSNSIVRYLYRKHTAVYKSSPQIPSEYVLMDYPICCIPFVAPGCTPVVEERGTSHDKNGVHPNGIKYTKISPG